MKNHRGFCFFKGFQILPLLLFICTAAGAQPTEVSSQVLKSLPGLENKPSWPEQKFSFIVLDFWASWCSPCHESAAFLAAQSKIWKNQKILWLGINEDQDLKAAQAFLNQQDPILKTSFMQLRDPYKKLANSLSIDTLPRLFILDSNFKILWSQRGFTPDKRKQIEKQFRAFFSRP